MLPAKAWEHDTSIVVDVLTLREILVQEMGYRAEDACVLY
jgi:hypothetical protein